MQFGLFYPTVNGVPLSEGLWGLLSSEPLVAAHVIDSRGEVRFINPRAAELLIREPPSEIVGQSLQNVFGECAGGERLAIVQRTLKFGTPILYRHIRFGVQVQCAHRAISSPDQAGSVLVISIEGEADPLEPQTFEIVESEFAHLGPLEVLSGREIEVLALIGQGMTAGQISAALYRSHRTIERHCENIRAKLGAADRSRLVQFARLACLRLEDASLKRV